MIRRLLFFFMLSSIIKVSAQEGTPGQIKSSFVQVKDDDVRNNKPVRRPCLLWLPASYSDNSNSPFYPLLIFLHSSKEGGNVNGTDVNALKKNGPFYFLQNKKWNGTADYGGNCGQPGFIVFAMQANIGSAIDAGEVNYAIGQLLLRFRIDETRIIFTGINEGAETILRYIFNSTYSYQPKLVLPMSVPFTSDHTALTSVAKRGTKVWAFTFDKDIKAGIDYRSTTVRLASNFNKAVVNSAKLTITTGTNCCWNKYYDPAFKEPDSSNTKQPLNIYEWIMKNISWGDASPPIYTCPDYVITPFKFAGYISAAKQNKKKAIGSLCDTPVYTLDGKIKPGSIIYSQKSGENFVGNNLHYGYSTLKLKATAANRHLVIDPEGKVITFE